MIAKRRNAISWVRFSTLEQKQGRSGRRQIDIAGEVCQEKGWNLVDDLKAHFEGVSAFHGKPISEFISLVEDGTIPPKTILVVEQFNRLDRNSPALAFKAFYRLLELDIDVYIFTLNTLFTKKEMDARDGHQMQLATDAQRQASQDSEIKRGWALRHWAMAREDLRNSTKFLAICKTCPFGFTTIIDEEGDRVYIPHPEESLVVKRIYHLSSLGWTAEKIERDLNQEGLKPRLGKVWNKSSIQKILTSRVYCGEFPIRKGTTNLQEEPIPNVFPLILTPQEFAEGFIVTSDETPNGHFRDRRDSNLFSFIGRCSKCGSQVYSKRIRNGYKSQCYDSSRGLCSMGTLVRREFVEASIIDSILRFLNPVHLKPMDDKTTDNLRKRLSKVESEIETIQSDLQTIAARMAKEKDDDLYQAFKVEREQTKKHLQDLQGKHHNLEIELTKASGGNAGLIERRNEIEDIAAQAIFGIPGSVRMELKTYDLKTKSAIARGSTTHWWKSYNKLNNAEQTEARERLKIAISKTVRINGISIDLKRRSFQVTLINDLVLPKGRIFDPTVQDLDWQFEDVLDGLFIGWLASKSGPKRQQQKARDLLAKLEGQGEDL